MKLVPTMLFLLSLSQFGFGSKPIPLNEFTEGGLFEPTFMGQRLNSDYYNSFPKDVLENNLNYICQLNGEMLRHSIDLAQGIKTSGEITLVNESDHKINVVIAYLYNDKSAKRFIIDLDFDEIITLTTNLDHFGDIYIYSDMSFNAFFSAIETVDGSIKNVKEIDFKFLNTRVGITPCPAPCEFAQILHYIYVIEDSSSTNVVALLERKGTVPTLNSSYNIYYPTSSNMFHRYSHGEPHACDRKDVVYTRHPDWDVVKTLKWTGLDSVVYNSGWGAAVCDWCAGQHPVCDFFSLEPLCDGAPERTWTIVKINPLCYIR